MKASVKAERPVIAIAIAVLYALENTALLALKDGAEQQVMVVKDVGRI